MSWRHQMILYRSELVGLVTYIYKIVPHTRGFYSRVCVYVARAARVCSCACASIFVRISAVPWALGSWAHGAGGWGECEWRVGSGPRSIALHAPKPSGAGGGVCPVARLAVRLLYVP